VDTRQLSRGSDVDAEIQIFINLFVTFVCYNRIADVVYAGNTCDIL